MEHYSVRLTKDDLFFSAGHFITLAGNLCERLHGHNYRVGVEVHGPLDENQVVVDFAALRNALRQILSELDHRVLLPTEHPSIRVATEGREVVVTSGERRWAFPQDECVLLPISNTTSELLAHHVGRCLLKALESRTKTRPTLVRVEVEESPGESAVCELRDV